MSSMRNAVQRRNHKERAQPHERQKWGLLEKAKDYKLRAADHREKKKKLKVLTQKARDRNPDEFSYKMLSSRVDKYGRRLTDRGNQSLSVEVVKLLKTQDAGYIRTMLQVTRKEREELEEQLMLEKSGEVKAVKTGSVSRKEKHRVFVDDKDEQLDFDADSWFGRGEAMPVRDEPQADFTDDSEVDAKQPEHVSSKQIETEQKALKAKRNFETARKRAQSRAVTKLDNLRKREAELRAAEDELENQRAKMNRTVGGTNKEGVKFKVRERKR